MMQTLATRRPLSRTTNVAGILSPPLLAFGVVFLLLIVRMPESVFRAEFYADDGALFTQALTRGPITLIEPLASYLAIGLRSIVFLETLVPPRYAPLLGSLVALAAVAGAAALACSARMPWDCRRGYVIAVGIGLLPASYPVIGNLAHVMWPIWLWMAFTAISVEPRWRFAESIGLFIGGLTGPAAVILWPLFLWGSRRRLVAIGAAAVIQVAVIVIEDRSSLLGLDTVMLPYVVLMRGVVTPLFGPTIATEIGPLATIAIGGPLLACIGLLLFRSRLRWWIGFLLVASPAAGILLAGAPTGWYANAELFPRYFWIPSAMLVVLVVLEFSHAAAVPLVAALLVGIVAEARIEAWPAMYWSERSGCIGGPRACDVPVAPAHDWNVHWRPPGGRGSTNRAGG